MMGQELIYWRNFEMIEKQYEVIIKQTIIYRVPVGAFDESEAEEKAKDMLAGAEDCYFDDLVDEEVIAVDEYEEEFEDESI